MRKPEGVNELNKQQTFHKVYDAFIIIVEKYIEIKGKIWNFHLKIRIQIYFVPILVQQ